MSFSEKQLASEQTKSSNGHSFDDCSFCPNQDRTFVKHDANKARHELIPPIVNKVLASVLTYGAIKYGDHNWMKCDDPTRFIGAHGRHISEWLSGNEIDPDSGFSHLELAFANLAFLIALDVKSPDTFAKN